MNSQTDAPARVPGTCRLGPRPTGLAGRARRRGVGSGSAGSTVVLPDGSRRLFGDEAAELQAEIHIHDGEP